MCDPGRSLDEEDVRRVADIVFRFLGWKYPNEPLPKVNIILGAIALPALFYCKLNSILPGSTRE